MERTVAPPRSAVALTTLSLGLAAVASAVTLLWQGAFPSPGPLGPNAVLAEARGWSAVTLVLAIPLGAVSLSAATRGSRRGHLAWAGVLAYLVYTYLELAVSGPFTPLYLIHIATFALALPALVLAVGAVSVRDLAGTIGPYPYRLTGGYALLTGVGLGAAWLRSILARTLAGSFGWPGPVESVGQVVQALDLGLQVPLAVVAGVLLLQRRAAGFLLGGIALTMGACMAPALAAMVAVRAHDAGQGLHAAWPFAAFAGVAIVLCAIHLRAIGQRA